MPPIPELAKVVPREVVAIKLPPAVLETAQQRGFTVLDMFDSPLLGGSVARLQVPADLTEKAARDLLNIDAQSNAATLNSVYRPIKLSHDGSQGPKSGQPAGRGPCLPDRCYGPASVGWRPQLAACASGLVVGMIDTGVDSTHPAFEGRHITFGEAIPPGTEAPAPQWHGTGVLSILAGNSESGIPGLIPDARFFAVNIFFADGAGNAVSDSSSVVKALGLMDHFGVQVINMSLSGSRDELVEQAIRKLTAKGVVILAAAGNGGPDAPPSYPAAYPQVIAVTAVNRNLLAYRHANRGSYIDVAAPGVDIWTALPGVQEGTQTGTSFAVPYATAIVAAMYKNLPEKSKSGVLNALNTADLGAPGRDPIYGRGLIQAPPTCLPPERSPQVAVETTVLPGATRAQAGAFGFGPSAGK